MTNSLLSPGVHDYKSILLAIEAGSLSFAEVRTAVGDWVPLIGVSPQQLDEMKCIACQHGFPLIIFGSRVAGPRTWQRRLHPVLEHGISLVSHGRHRSVGIASVEGVVIPKNAIKELGIDDPTTSDLSVAIITEGKCLDEVKLAAIDIEQSMNTTLGLRFPIRVYVEIFGCYFRGVDEFVRFGREKYIKKDLPPGHRFSDEDIDQAFKMLFAILECDGGSNNEF